MQMGVRERDGAREGGIERLGWCLGLISLLVIIVASCWMLDTWAASASGQQLSTTQQGKAKAGSRSRQGEAPERRVPSGWKLSRQLAPWPLTIATEHPAWQQKYADACTCSTVASMVYPCVM